MEEREFSFIGQQVDLTNCDREPIHIPGRIQPHGVLLAFQEPELKILQVSENTTDLLGIEPEELIDQRLGCLLDQEQLTYLQTILHTQNLENNPLYVFTLKARNKDLYFDGIVHRSQGLVILELEQFKHHPETGQQNVYHTVRTTLAQIQQSTDVNQFCRIAAEQVQAITGFDRVMVYRFDEQWNGQVIAESVAENIDSFMGLHYPASDIPAQARRLYTLNWLRLIADVHYVPSPIIPTANPITGRPLDLSYSMLRSVSPIHVEYLKNMGVGASMSISLVNGDDLWGLIACHHYSPKYIPYDVRTACEFLAQVVSLQLVNRERKEDQEELLRLKSTQEQFVEMLAEEQDLTDGLTRRTPDLLDFVDASGAAILFEGKCQTLGKTPDQQQIRALVEWLSQQTREEIFSTHTLNRVYPAASQFQEVASGILAIMISRARRNAILWFRPEVIQTVTWGGDPNKAVTADDDGLRLHPRKSFEQWKQTVRATALPWKTYEVLAAGDLRTALLNVVLRQVDTLARLNTELERSNQELDSFAYIASHDLKEPLRGIHNYSIFLMEDYVEKLDEEGVTKLRTLVRLTKRMEDLIDSLLHYSRVGRLDLAFQQTDLNQVLEDSLEMLQARVRETGAQIRIPRPLPTVYCDQARIGEVFSNLISNALKYNERSERWIEIGYTTASQENDPSQSGYVFFIRDNGIGIQEKYYTAIFRIFKRLHNRDKYGGGTGAGLTIVQKIVERHGGRIWVESTPGQGTTFYFTLTQELSQEG